MAKRSRALSPRHPAPAAPEFITLANMGRTWRMATTTATFGADILAHLKDESHQSQESTYLAMRRAYVQSRGRSSWLLAAVFQGARRGARNALPDLLQIAGDVQHRGYAVRHGFLDPAVVRDLTSYFAEQPGSAVGSNFSRIQFSSIRTVERGLKFDYATPTILAAPHVLDIAADEAILGAAANYLHSEPILAGVNVWWSLADSMASRDELSGAAQLYHFDCDHPAFVKFFLYLTDVEEQDGPFAFIEGTHRAKPVWRDGRFADQELLANYNLAPLERKLTGPAGTLLAVDTSGFHKGTPVARHPRLILQLHFAVTRLGASKHYPLYPSQLRPASPFSHAYDVFAA